MIYLTKVLGAVRHINVGIFLELGMIRFGLIAVVRVGVLKD